MDELTEKQLRIIEETEPTLGLSKGFCAALLKEDDWSFVIKTHALVESALSRLVEAIVQPPAAGEFAASLNLAGGWASKVKLLLGCDRMDKDEAKYVRALSDIRNLLVHDVSYTTFDLAAYADKLDSEEKKKLSGTLEGLVTGNTLADLKESLWLCAVHVVAMATLRTGVVKTESQIPALEHRALAAENVQLKQLLAAVEALSARPKGRGLASYLEELGRVQGPGGEMSGPDKGK